MVAVSINRVKRKAAQKGPKLEVSKPTEKISDTKIRQKSKDNDNESNTTPYP